MIACVGAANSLANPSRLLKAVPGALYEVGVVVVVALTPRAAGRRGRPAGAPGAPAARPTRPRARGAAGRWRCPCSRARSSARSSSPRRWTPAATAVGPRCPSGRGASRPGWCSAGSWAWSSASTACSTPAPPAALGLPLVVAGGVLAAVGFRLAGRRSIRTRYRPDPWRGPEWVTVLSGAVPAIVLVLARASGDAGAARPLQPARLADGAAATGTRDPRRDSCRRGRRPPQEAPAETTVAPPAARRPSKVAA